MFLFRFALRANVQTRILHQISTPTTTTTAAAALALRRGYVSAKKGAKSTASFVPGSQQRLADATAQAEYDKAEAGMRTSVDWYRRECAAVESRASGRVTPALLTPVRVKLADGSVERLEELGTVGVREGTTMLVTVFKEDTLKAVEQALYDSKIPGIVPQRQDERTIRIPVPKPTVEARTAQVLAAQRKAEEIRVQVRKQHQTSVKKGGYGKRSVEVEEFQKLADRYIKEVDQILANLKKATGTK